MKTRRLGRYGNGRRMHPAGYECRARFGHSRAGAEEVLSRSRRRARIPRELRGCLSGDIRVQEYRSCFSCGAGGEARYLGRRFLCAENRGCAISMNERV